jgi:molybdenum cofactor biosynthesis enzyme MoaA
MNEGEVADFAALTKTMPITVRFIEFMPLGRSGLTDRPEESMITEAQIRASIEAVHGALAPVRRDSETGVGPAKVWMLPGAVGRVGFISAMSNPFCESCNRLRLTPDGLLRSCLFDGGEIDLKPLLRGGNQVMGIRNQELGGKTEEVGDGGDLKSVHERLMEAFTSCVVMKPETHSFHGNKAMNRIGG